MSGFAQRVEKVDDRSILLPEFWEERSPHATKTTRAVSYRTADDLRKIIAEDKGHLLITGETGTGKEMIAQLIERDAKGRRGYYPLNCAALHPDLRCSELFGHKKGSFTGAIGDHQGLLERYADGILFLDEIGQLPMEGQAQLLRIMRGGGIRPIGSNEDRGLFRGRIICATNQDVKQCLQHDFRCRFAFEIYLPPLRERDADILWFLCAPRFEDVKNNYEGIELHSLLGMIAHDWPGNIPELISHLKNKSFWGDNSSHRAIIHDDRRVGSSYRWSLFASYILSMIGRKSALLQPSLGNDAAMRVMELLAYTAKIASDALSSPVVPMKMLRQMISDSPDNLEFDFSPLAGILNGNFNKRRIDDGLFYGGSGNFLEALFILRRLFEQFKESKLWNNLESGAGDLMARHGCFCSDSLIDPFLSGGRLNNLIVPASAIVTIDSGAKMAVLDLPRMEDVCQKLERNADKDFITLLDRHVSDICDRAICLVCNTQKSVRKIARELTLKPQTVHDRLVNLRSLAGHALEKYLPKQRKGNKPKVKSSG